MSSSAHIDEASALLKRFAEPIRVGDKAKAQIARAARASGLEYWPAYDLWYRKASDKAAELFVRRMKDRAQSCARELANQAAEEDAHARDEIAELRSRVAELERRIASLGASPAA